jgi:RNA polymerase sigma-70 factor (ECF subfamily)
MTVLARAESGAQIQAALEKLPPKLRSAVVLHDIEGLSYEDIAVVERIPLGTVKSRIFSARAALRKRLRFYWES